ncbi:MAG TPA: Tim44/TimA family putative adaptor protein [Alphaproteobacteria bacterium]|nr:Tim44/TimA family putative adaptor protein [Alphaproteobacteria bacterium]
MGDFLFIDILIFAMIAAFLVFRLRNVLGRRTGNEQQRPNPFSTQSQRPPDAGPDNVVTLPGRDGQDQPAEARGSGRHGLTQVRIADPSFDQRGFAEGAKIAFGMIVEAFAKGDTATLRPLLSDDLYDEFSAAIRDRLAAANTLETRVDEMKSAEIVDGRVEGRTAFVTVRFVTRQINVTRDQAGDVVEGDPDTPVEVTDIWTFARNTRSTDPNWMLVETATPA